MIATFDTSYPVPDALVCIMPSLMHCEYSQIFVDHYHHYMSLFDASLGIDVLQGEHELYNCIETMLQNTGIKCSM